MESAGFLDILDIAALSGKETRILEATYRSCILTSIRHLVSPDPFVDPEHTPLTRCNGGRRLPPPAHIQPFGGSE